MLEFQSTPYNIFKTKERSILFTLGNRKRYLICCWSFVQLKSIVLSLTQDLSLVLTEMSLMHLKRSQKLPVYLLHI